MKIVSRNMIKCNLCGDEIESIHRHDFKWCKCKSVAVDGGTYYLKRLGNLDHWTDISEYREPTKIEKIDFIKDHIDEYLSMFEEPDLDIAIESIEQILKDMEE